MEVSDLEDGTEPTKIINVTNEESLNLMGSPPDAVGMLTHRLILYNSFSSFVLNCVIIIDYIAFKYCYHNILCT